MKNFILFLFFFSIANVFSASYLKVIYVADYTINCGNKQCLLTRESPTDTFTVFNDNIEGFSYQKGFEYCILLEIETSNTTDTLTTENNNKIKYKLSEIKSKIPTNKLKTTVNTNFSIPDSSKWILYKLKMKDGTRTFSITKAYILFDIKNNTINGSTDCNSFNATIANDSLFKIENIITTKMACKKLSIEKDFLSMLHEVNKYKITKKLLYLYNNKKLLALFTRKQ
jgi:heat shock protein HslJ